MSTFSLPAPPTAFAIRLLRGRNALLPCDAMGRTSGFGAKLSPVTSSAHRPRSVSCYALFEWWPLLSLHSDCQRTCTSFHVKLGLGDLIAESGLFPSPLRTLALVVRLPSMIGAVFGVWLGSADVEVPSPSQCSTPAALSSAPYLNRFRREPAISEFDWPFTPNHRSSQPFATGTSSALRPQLNGLRPAHG